MRFAVDAHAIGRHFTGNEVYIRSLLKAFAAQTGLRIRSLRLLGEAAAAIPRNITRPRLGQSVRAARLGTGA